MSERAAMFWRMIARGANKLVIVSIYLSIIVLFFCLPMFIDRFFPQNSLNICAFTQTFSPEAIELFEKETGIKINLTYVELDEQIHAKFKVNNGVGYDVINVSDFMVQMLHSQNMLHRIDRSLVSNFDRISPYLLNHSYDPKNLYGIPHKWFMYGIAYDKNFFKLAPEDMSYRFLFQESSSQSHAGAIAKPYKVCMIDSPVDAYFLAGLYLSRGLSNKNGAAEQAQIEKLLIEQKKWVECYTLYTVEYFLLTGLTPIVITSSNFIRKIWGVSDRFNFAIPREGGILVIENLAIPKNSTKIEKAYKFINFMLSDKIARLNSSEYGWMSSNKNSIDATDLSEAQKQQILLNDELIKRLHIPLFSQEMRSKIDDIWLKVGFA